MKKHFKIAVFAALQLGAMLLPGRNIAYPIVVLLSLAILIVERKKLTIKVKEEIIMFTAFVCLVGIYSNNIVVSLFAFAYLVCCLPLSAKNLP